MISQEYVTMVNLSVVINSSKERIKLEPGIVFIGRAKDCHISISDKTISARHARIVTYFNASYIEDLSSTNGTYLNGKRVKMHTLHPGDEIALGQQRMIIG
jgi:pSer/pThr/pTyr-binding forkhead associated (FHA) protein